MAKREKEHSHDLFNFFNHHSGKSGLSLSTKRLIAFSCMISSVLAAVLATIILSPILSSDPQKIQSIQAAGINESSAMMATALDTVNTVMMQPQNMQKIKEYMTEDGFALYQQEIANKKAQAVINMHPEKLKVADASIAEVQDNRYMIFTDIEQIKGSIHNKVPVLMTLQQQANNSSTKTWKVSSLQFVHSN